MQTTTPSEYDLVPLPLIWRERRFGVGRSRGYEMIEQGLLPIPIDLGGKLRVLTRGEIDAVNRARAAGASDDEVRDLVRDLVAARKTSVTAAAS